jgi:hypothetical protein
LTSHSQDGNSTPEPQPASETGQYQNNVTDTSTSEPTPIAAQISQTEVISQGCITGTLNLPQISVVQCGVVEDKAKPTTNPGYDETATISSRPSQTEVVQSERCVAKMLRLEISVQRAAVKDKGDTHWEV